MPPLQSPAASPIRWARSCWRTASLAALLARDRFGLGQEVDASHLGSMIWLQGLSVAARLMMGLPSRAIAASPPIRSGTTTAAPTASGWRSRMLQPDRYWARLLRVLGIPEPATDERFRRCSTA